MHAESPEVLWRPPADVRTSTNIGRYLTWVEEHHDVRFADYEDAWRWSVDDLERFWGSLAEFYGVQFHDQPSRVLEWDHMKDARWFPGGTLNYAEHILRGDPDEIVLLARSESRAPEDITRGELRAKVAAFRAGLEQLGVTKGDRVAAYISSTPEAVVALLATASLGAIWTMCSPEFGVRGTVDRLSQVAPKVLIAVDGYRYAGRDFSRGVEVAAILEELPSVENLIWIPNIGGVLKPAGALLWDEIAVEAEPAYTTVPFDHPLYVLFSSGTTGKPKAVVHAHGRMLIEHFKWLGIHDDIGPGSRYYWYASTSWVAWNVGLSTLLCGASLVIWDGAVSGPDLASYWQFVADCQITHLGTTPGFLQKCRASGLVPMEHADLSRLQHITAGGAPVPEDLFRWIYSSVSPTAYVSAPCGGTELASPFVSGCVMVPVRAGRIACRLLGVEVYAFDEEGRSVVGSPGELVAVKPMPSMLVRFWGDDDQSRLVESYFSMYEGVWRHGDWITFWPDGTSIVTGRSDATLNRGGVRLGSNEFYALLERSPEISDSLVVHLEDPDGGSGRLLLFVSVADETTRDEGELKDAIRSTLREGLSPRHVPDEIHVVPEIPRTVTGKRMEVPVKRILQGMPMHTAADRASALNPASLDGFTSFVTPAPGLPSGSASP